MEFADADEPLSLNLHGRITGHRRTTGSRPSIPQHPRDRTGNLCVLCSNHENRHRNGRSCEKQEEALLGALRPHPGEKMRISFPPTYSPKLLLFPGGAERVHGFPVTCFDVLGSAMLKLACDLINCSVNEPFCQALKLGR